MCGRFAYFGNGSFGYESLHLPEPPPIESYNIAPSQNVLAIRRDPKTNQAEYAMLHWGLIPSWSLSEKTKYTLINARAEGIEKKPSFRGPFKHQRCIVPASGFFEWLQSEGRKQPFYFRPSTCGYFALAGLWDHWQDEKGSSIESCTIITTSANRLMRQIHDRMPAILSNKDVPLWLDPDQNKEDLLALLVPFADKAMEAYPVSARVNSPKNNDPQCVDPTGSLLALV